jgi:vacuolar-type H+-ATPase subunit I/STV1
MLINDPQKLDALRDQLKHLIREETSTTRWNRRRDEFLKELPSLLDALKPLGSIPAAEADKLRKERDRYQEESVALDERVEQLQEQVAALEKAKSAEDVRAIRREFSDEADNFEEVLGATQNALSALPRVVTTALFYDRREETFLPDYDEWQNAPREAAEENLLTESEGKFWPKESHPKIIRAIDALRELEEFVRGVSPEFRQDYQDEHDDLLDVHSKTFWKRHNLF